MSVVDVMVVVLELTLRIVRMCGACLFALISTALEEQLVRAKQDAQRHAVASADRSSSQASAQNKYAAQTHPISSHYGRCLAVHSIVFAVSLCHLIALV
jgi:hypothetical protein